MNQIITIWIKELKDTLRDRRTLMSMLVMPIVLMPLLIIGMGKLIEFQVKQAEGGSVKVAIQNNSQSQPLTNLIKDQEKIDVVSVEGDLKEQIRTDKIDAALIIPNNFNDAIKNMQPVQIKVLSQSTDQKSSVATARINTALAKYNSLLLTSRFQANNINPSIVTTVSLLPEDVTTEKERGGFGLGFIIPLIVMMWSIVGGMYIAIDVSAGEKERKTLEPLLMTPISRMQIVLGKFLAVSTAALIAVIAGLSSLYFTIKKFGFGSSLSSELSSGASGSLSNMGLDFSIELQALVLMFIVSIFLVLMFSAMLLSIAIFAKSYKEAQSYISPIYIAAIMPAVVVNTMPGFKPSLSFFAIPAVNAMLLFKEILIGVYDTSHILLTVGSLMVYSSIAIFLAAKIYSKESVLLR